MMAPWMVHCVAVALCCSAGAHAVEHLLRLYRKPARGVGVAVLGASLLVPVVNWVAAGIFVTGAWARTPF